jgi:hypothetical protein
LTFVDAAAAAANDIVDIGVQLLQLKAPLLHFQCLHPGQTLLRAARRRCSSIMAIVVGAIWTGAAVITPADATELDAEWRR